MTTTETMRFYDDPLAPVSAQFPLTRPGMAAVDNTEAPSAPDTRPFGLRYVRAMPEPVVPAYEYSHDQQVSVADDSSEVPMVKLSPNMEWSSTTDNDGDEGPSEDWGNDFARTTRCRYDGPHLRSGLRPERGSGRAQTQ